MNTQTIQFMESDMSEFTSEFSEAAELVRMAAEPRPVGDSVKAAIRRASNRLGWSHARVKNIWYREARRIDAHEMDALRGLAQRYANIATTLRHQDEDFYGTQADLLEHYASRLGAVARARNWEG
jgi:hypothetical protein